MGKYKKTQSVSDYERKENELKAQKDRCLQELETLDLIKQWDKVLDINRDLSIIQLKLENIRSDISYTDLNVNRIETQYAVIR